MKKSPTILQVLPRLVTGGVERGTVEVTAALTKAGWRALVASEGGPMVKEVEQAGGLHLTLPLASKNPWTIGRNIQRLADIVKSFDVDLIHARSRAPAWSAYYAARRTHRPFVTTFHNAYGAQSSLKRLYNSVMAKGIRVIAISDFVADYARKTYGVSSEKIRVIARGVDIERFSPEAITAERCAKLRQEWDLTTTSPVLMLPGRLTRWKGQTLFIHALAALPHRHFRALLVGSGSDDYRHELQLLIDKLHLNSCVSLVGECKDMPAALFLATFVISPSLRPEGFGRVIVEAEALGKPVIASNHGGAQVTVIPQTTGWLVPVNDTQALSAALVEALSLTPESYETMSTEAMNFVRAHFSTTLMTTRTLSVYEEILALS